MQRRLRASIVLAGWLGFAVVAGALSANASGLADAAYHLPVVFKEWTPPTEIPFSFVLQPGSPAYVANIANSNGCNWFGMAGQVFDLQNKGVVGLFVHVDGGSMSFDSPTGAFPKYGSSGWEVSLGTAPVTTTATYRLQLRNGAGQPLSDNHGIPTFADCNKNQIIVNFVQSH